MSRSLPILFALAAALAAAGPSSSSQDISAPSGYSVRGTVINAISGQPVPRALISLDQDFAMLTGSDGGFSFDNVSAGQHSVSVQKPGYQGFGRSITAAMGTVHSGADRLPRRIQVGPDMPTLAFSITPLGVIAGHITLSTADPADGIQIEAYTRALENGRPHWRIGGRARTRSDGSFRIAELLPGTYMLSTRPSLDRPPSRNNPNVPVWGYPALYYPGVADPSAAGTLTLAAGQQAEADLTLVRQQFFPVTAVVASSSDTPANFEILDSAGRPTGLSAFWNRREGLVHATVPNGTWTMEAHAYGQTMQWGSVTFQVNSAPVSFPIALSPVPHIPVNVRHDDSNPSQTPASGPGLNLLLEPADGFDLPQGAGLEQTSNGDGTQYNITVTQPGRYWIQGQPFTNEYVSSITSGGVDLAANPLIVQTGTAPAPIEITLRNDTGTLTGQIVTQNLGAAANPTTPGAEPQVWIYAIPLFPTITPLHDIMPNPDGQFSFYNLAPGSYRVVACDTPQDIDYHSAEGLAAWAGKGQTVTLDPSGTASVELNVIHAGAAQ